VDEFAEQARAAYAAGWAATSGPMTDRVRAGCVAAVQLACDHRGELGVLEATMRLGQLEGTWAAVYERREQVYDDSLLLALVAWQELVAATLDVGGAVLAFRRRLNLASESTAEDDDLVAESIAAALGLLVLLLTNRDEPRRRQLVDVLAEALRTAQAEGVVTALALAAEQVDVVGLDLDAVFRDALAEVGDTTTDAEALLVLIVRAAASDLARKLAKLVRNGADYDEMLTEVDAFLYDDNLRGLVTQLDQGIGEAMSRAGLGWYVANNVRLVDFVTVGGYGVCVHCEDEESKNPHRVGEVLAPPLHPHCRCTLRPTSPIQSLNVSRYLGGP
jgi:hypothetical protein